MGSLAKTTASHLPTPISLPLADTLSRFSNKLTAVGLGHEILAHEAPSNAEREHLEIRRNALASWLRPCDDEHLVKQVIALMGSRPGQFGGQADQKIAIRIFVEVLKSQPRFAIDKAFDDAHAGRLGAPPWVPTPADLNLAASKHVTKVAAEKSKIDAVLNAKVVDREVDPARRKAVVAKAREALKNMRDAGLDAERQRDARMSKEPPPPKPETQVEAEARWKAPMPPLSAELLKKFPKTEVAA